MVCSTSILRLKLLQALSAKKQVTEQYVQYVATKSPQSCLTLCNPIDGSPLGSAIPGILQARTLEWVAISFSNAWKWKVKKLLSRVRLLATPWTAAYQAPPSMGFSRQEYWSGWPLPSLAFSLVIKKSHPPKRLFNRLLATKIMKWLTRNTEKSGTPAGKDQDRYPSVALTRM